MLDTTPITNDYGEEFVRRCQRKLHDAVTGPGYGARYGKIDQPISLV